MLGINNVMDMMNVKLKSGFRWGKLWEYQLQECKIECVWFNKNMLFSELSGLSITLEVAIDKDFKKNR